MKISTNPPTHIYINRNNNRSMFKIEDWNKLELQTFESLKLFGSTKKVIDKIKNGENVPCLEVAGAILVQCMAININKSLRHYIFFSPSKSCAFLLNVETNNLVFLKSYNTGFSDVIITFTSQNRRLLEMNDKFSLALLINSQKWHVILYNQEQKSITKNIDFCNSHGMYSTNISKRQKLLNTATKARLIHKSIEATEELIGNKIAKQIVKRKYLLIWIQKTLKK